MTRDLSPCRLVERSVQKKFRKTIWNPFIAGVKRYQLIREGDKIAVCISGGKDSMLMAKLMQALQLYSEVPFSLCFLVMDPGYNAVNRERILANAALLELPLTVFHTDIFQIVDGVEQSPCYLCARMRRGHLYSKAQELGCNKIALGHHFSDVVETVLMGMLYGAQVQTMMPKLHSRNFPGMELIRPLYCVHEDDILAWKRYNHLDFIQCACRITERISQGEGGSKRQEIKEMLREMKKTNPNVEKNIFRSIHMVNLDTVIGYRLEGRELHFWEDYDSRVKGNDSEE